MLWGGRDIKIAFCTKCRMIFVVQEASEYKVDLHHYGSFEIRVSP
jgi:hypothetical protein